MTSIAVYKELGILYNEIYFAFMTISGTLGAFKVCVQCYNMPTDLLGRKELNRTRRAMTHAARQSLFQTMDSWKKRETTHGVLQFRTDMIELKLDNITWQFDGGTP